MIKVLSIGMLLGIAHTGAGQIPPVKTVRDYHLLGLVRSLKWERAEFTPDSKHPGKYVEGARRRLQTVLFDRDGNVASEQVAELPSVPLNSGGQKPPPKLDGRQEPREESDPDSKEKRLEVHDRVGRIVGILAYNKDGSLESVVQYRYENRFAPRMFVDADGIGLGDLERPGSSKDDPVVVTLIYSGDRTLLMRISSAYEYDWAGNWTKSTDTVMGEKYKPITVDYRTITYY